jgi:ABC-type branched-subunit amino acid transport system substrate-binding protein
MPIFSGLAASPTKTVKIGATVALKSKEGVQIKRWLELLSERLNKEGGLVVKGERYNVQMIIYDDDLTVEGGRAAGERLIYQDKVKYVICQFNSPPVLGVLSVAQPNKVLQIGNGITEKTMDPQYQYYYRAPSLFFNGLQPFMTKYMKDLGLPPSVVILAPDDATGHGGAENYKIIYKNMGIKVLDTLFYKRETSDYTPFATKVKSLNPGFVDTGPTNAGAPTLLLAKALYEVGYKGGKIFNKEKWVQDLADAYEKKYGVWETDGIAWIHGWFILMNAIRKADSLDVEDLRKVMPGLETDAIGGRLRFVSRPDLKNPRYCDSVAEFYPGVVKNGKFQPLKKVSMDESYELVITAFGLEDVYKLKK